MEVRLLENSPENQKAWNQYVEKNPFSTSDHLWEWRDILSETFGFRRQFYLAADSNGKVAGILPLYQIRSGLLGRKSTLASIPYGNYGGICADSAEAANALLEHAKEIGAQFNSTHIELKHKNKFYHDDLQQLPRSTHSRFFLPLLKTEKEIFDALGQNNRSKIRRAEKDGLKGYFLNDADEFYRIYSHTAHRQGTPCFPKKYFQQILSVFPDKAKIYFVERQGKSIACYLMIFFKKIMVAQFSCSYSEYYSSYPNEFIFWKVIQEGLKNGMQELDFCRSRTNSGTANFKRKLRYHEESLDYQYAVAPGQELPFSQDSKSEKYQLAIQTWKKMPQGVANFLGPKVLRYFA